MFKTSRASICALLIAACTAGALMSESASFAAQPESTLARKTVTMKRHRGSKGKKNFAPVALKNRSAKSGKGKKRGPRTPRPTPVKNAIAS